MVKLKHTLLFLHLVLHLLRSCVFTLKYFSQKSKPENYSCSQPCVYGGSLLKAHSRKHCVKLLLA